MGNVIELRRRPLPLARVRQLVKDYNEQLDVTTDDEPAYDMDEDDALLPSSNWP
jgi:hypothetical protein